MDIIKKHFSLDDWDFSTPAPYLDTTVYVSSPTSLAARYAPPFNRYGYAFCKLPLAQNVPDGRIISYNYYGYSINGVVKWYYRAQTYPPAADGIPANSYRICWGNNYVIIQKTVNGQTSTIARYDFSPYLSLNTWHLFRATWWQYTGAGPTTILRHRIEHYKDGNWVTLIDFDDGNNHWAGSSVNMVGVQLSHAVENRIEAVDDTEIWKKI